MLSDHDGLEVRWRLSWRPRDASEDAPSMLSEGHLGAIDW
jgi:hypothetical protein